MQLCPRNLTKNAEINRKTQGIRRKRTQRFKVFGYDSLFGKLKFKIKNHRISTKAEFMGPKLKLFGKKNLEQFWSKFAPPELRLIEHHRVSN